MARKVEFKLLWVGLALLAPWLNPFAGGPWPAAVSSLVSMACVSVLCFSATKWRLSCTRLIAWAWLFAALTSSAIGVVQYFGVSAWFQPWINTTQAGEAFANLRQRNQFATLTNIGLVALVWLGTCRKIASVPVEPVAWAPNASAPEYPRAWASAAAVALAVGNAASASRTGMLQLFLVGGVLVVWGRLRYSRVRWLLLLTGLAYAAGVFLLPRLAGLDPSTTGLLARLHDAGPACASRLVLWRNVLELITLKPWWGWGWGELDYAHFITLYSGPRFCEILDNAHNLPLHLAVELGLPLAAMVCGVGLWLVWRARPWRETVPARQMAWAVLALIVLHSMLEYPLWYGPFQIAVGLCVWILWSCPRASGAFTAAPEVRLGPRWTASGSSWHRMVVLISSIVLLAGVAYAAWDYRRVSQIYTAVERRAPAYRENTLEKIRASWLFRNQVRFAELSIATVTADNAAAMYTLATDLLHFSPESRVVEKLISSAMLLGRKEEAAFYVVRYQAAFPTEYGRWIKAPPVALPPPAPSKHSPAHYLWAVLIARIYEVFALLCPMCGGQMRPPDRFHYRGRTDQESPGAHRGGF